ncbi:SRPBCC family protein [Streptomyces sp. NPDC048603]|uniref:SRPBCC family protein n=1 Tax=Streptomyces sp. NPDC048603 TaxID=3365577 RepID=UPI0037109D2F
MDTHGTGAPTTRHISTHIDRPAADVYAFASNPANLPRWAHGLGTTIEHVDGRWIADSAGPGRVVVAFAPRNEFGVLDHDVTLPTGETVHNPMRVLPDAAGCEVVFTLRRRPGTTEEDFRHDAAAVRTDLTTLKELMERP